jgi:hypothetical protein
VWAALDDVDAFRVRFATILRRLEFAVALCSIWLYRPIVPTTLPGTESAFPEYAG